MSFTWADASGGVRIDENEKPARTSRVRMVERSLRRDGEHQEQNVLFLPIPAARPALFRYQTSRE
jgi:hypothetical protein